MYHAPSCYNTLANVSYGLPGILPYLTASRSPSRQSPHPPRLQIFIQSSPPQEASLLCHFDVLCHTIAEEQGLSLAVVISQLLFSWALNNFFSQGMNETTHKFWTSKKHVKTENAGGGHSLKDMTLFGFCFALENFVACYLNKNIQVQWYHVKVFWVHNRWELYELKTFT